MTPSWLQSETNIVLAGLIGLILAVLLIIWWRQRMAHWLQGLVLVVLWAGGATVLSAFLFSVPEYQAGCAAPCGGWSGYPVPVMASVSAGSVQLFPAGIALSFLLHLLLLLVLGAIAHAILADRDTIRWPPRGAMPLWLATFLVLWALIPRYASPPEPPVRGEPQRLAINAKRLAPQTVAEFDWPLQRLALEDVRRLPRRVKADAPGLPPPTGPDWRVCLRGYSFFYVPWRRVYVDLDTTGTYAIGGGVLPLTVECWSAPFPDSPYRFLE
jgi:hypothetical protein